MTTGVNPPRAPRDLADEPDGFGRAQNLQWKQVENLEMAALRLASRRQHEYALRIRGRIRATNRSLKSYAREAGTSYDRLGKMLRGVIVMRLEDLATADIILGEISATQSLDKSPPA